MIQFFAEFKELVGALVVVVTAIGGYLKWKNTQQKTNDLLLQEMDKLIVQLIDKGKAEVQNAYEMSELRKILLHIKSNCPKCYYETIEKYRINEREIMGED